jgi:hypothetical protein
MREYNPYIKSLEKTEHLYLMRSKVKRVELKNLDGHINRKRINFDKYNIISGAYGTGKTFLVHLIYDAYISGETELEWLTTHPDYRNASVKIVYNSISEWKYTYPKKSEDIDERLFEEHLDICFVFDEPDLIYNKDENNGFLNYLKGIDAQIIITSNLDKNFNYPKEYKIIKI